MPVTETAKSFSKFTLSTTVSVNTVRFCLCFTSLRNATAALHLLPFLASPDRVQFPLDLLH